MITDPRWKSSEIRHLRRALAARTGLFLLPFPQELARHAQPLCRQRAVSTGPPECFVDVRVRELPECPAPLDGGRKQRFRRPETARRKIRRPDLGSFGGEDGFLDDVTYGMCINCGQTIAEKRLTAVPWTPYCVDCQELSEKGMLPN